MRIVFMGTPDFSVPVLEELARAGHEICAVYCQPPRPAGRGKKERPSPVHQKAQALGLMVRHPASLRGASEQADFSALNADVAVVVAYGLILPKVILDAPRLGCINIHASLLPRWRGAAPIQRAIMAGDAETGICIMQMDAGLDTGPVLAQHRISINQEETAGDLHDRLSALGARAITEALEQSREWAPQAQPDDGVTYAEKIAKSEAQIDWSRPGEEVDRLIRGLSPFPGGWSLANDERIKFLRSTLSEMRLGIGETFTKDGRLFVGSSDKAVEILEAQRAGKRAGVVSELLKGWPPPKRFT